MFTVEDVSVNGYMIDPLWADTVAAGKKANEELSFSSSEFRRCGITSAEEIVFNLRIYDNDDWSADNFVDDTFAIYPTSLSAEEITYPERSTSSTEQILLDDENVSFIILEEKEDSIWGYYLLCYLENKTDKDLMFTWEDVSVNGYMIDPFWAEIVTAGKRSYEEIHFLNSYFEENDISSVEEVEFTLHIYDSDNWTSNAVFYDTLTYKPQ